MAYKIPLALKAREKGGRHNDTAHRKTQPQRVADPFGLVPRPREGSAPRVATPICVSSAVEFYSCPFAF